MTVAPRVQLRPPAPSDLALLHALRGDGALQHQLLAYPEGATNRAAVEAWVRRRQAERGGAFLIVADAANRPLGFVQVAQVHRRGRFGWMGMALAAEVRGLGCGGAALDALLAHAAGPLGLVKLLLEVRTDNAAAVALYERRGFRHVGVLEAHYDDGDRRHDVRIMERRLP